MENKLIKISKIGTYADYLQEFSNHEYSDYVEELKKGLSKKQLNQFGKYTGSISEDILEMNAFYPNHKYKEPKTSTTFTIESSNFSEKEINNALYLAFQYLSFKEKVDATKEFEIYRGAV